MGIVLFFVDALRVWLGKERPHDDPWRSGTLEWLPAEDYGVRSIPEVDSREPLWSRPDLTDEVVAGAHWLPGSVFGGRETLITHPRRARPMHLLVLTGDSWWPFVAGVCTAGFFLLLTVKWVVPASPFGLVAVAATLALGVADRSALGRPSGRGRHRRRFCRSARPAGLASVVGDARSSSSST